MWYLTSATDKRVIYVLPEKNITIGRSVDAQNCNFAVSEDQSISRKHTTLLLSEDVLYVKDVGSKYGTFVNSEKIDENVLIKLKCDDIVKFGKMGCVWNVQQINFVTCTSTLKGENLQNLKNLLMKLGGILKNEWDETCGYLTMPAITLTIKVVLALVQNSHIVTVKYWSKCFEAVTNNIALPDPGDFIPQILESTLNKENVSFLPLKERSSIFAGKKVIFFSRKQLDMYKTVLMKSSATALLLSETKLTKSALCDENVIVIQYNISSMGQETQSQKDQIMEITNYLKSKGKRIVADAEIGLAVLYCSTNKYCNPEFNFPSEVIKQVPNENVPKNVLALESQGPSQALNKKENLLIDESLTPKYIASDISSDTLNVGPKRKLCDDDSNMFTMNKKFAVDTTNTVKNSFNKRPPEDLNNLENKPSKKMALENNDDDNMFNFLKQTVIKDSDEANKNKRLNLSKPVKRKHSTDMDEEDLFNFVNKKPTIANASNSISESIDDNENVCPTIKIKNTTVVDDKVDIISLRGSKLEELKKINLSIPHHNNIKKEDVSELDNKFSNMDLGSTTLVVKTDLVVKREPLQVLSPQGGLRNFKKFKKVWPVKMQITVVPAGSFNVSNIEPGIAGKCTISCI